MTSRRQQREDVHQKYAREAVEEIIKDPRFNRDLTHPDTPSFRSRLLASPLLRGYYRPDLFHSYWYNRPGVEDVKKAIEECQAGLSPDVVWRTAHTEGVFYRFKTQEVLADHLCIVLFSRLTKADATTSETRSEPTEEKE